MHRLEISLDGSEFDNATRNWDVFQRVCMGQTFDVFSLYGITPFSMLILTLYLHPEWRRSARDLTWTWYGHAIHAYSSPPLQGFLALYDRYVRGHENAPDRAVGLWEAHLKDYLEVEEQLALDQNLWREEFLTPKVPYGVDWCLRLCGEDLFLWRRSALVTNPLLNHVLGEIHDLYGVLSLWSEKKDTSSYEGQFIQIPFKYLKERHNV